MKAIGKTPSKKTARTKATRKDGGKAGGECTRGRLPPDWRKRLPDPVEYYTAQLGRLGVVDWQGYAHPVSPFGGYFGVHLKRGNWYVICGRESGGDMVRFHQLLTGLDPLEAIWSLLEWKP